MAACSGGKDEGTKEAALPWDSDEVTAAAI